MVVWSGGEQLRVELTAVGRQARWLAGAGCGRSLVVRKAQVGNRRPAQVSVGWMKPPR